MKMDETDGDWPLSTWGVQPAVQTSETPTPETHTAPHSPTETDGDWPLSMWGVQSAAQTSETPTPETHTAPHSPTFAFPTW